MGYPVKYAVEELKVEGGYITNGEDVIKGYIVSKCYLIEDRISYDESYEVKGIKHLVAFPYVDFEDFITYKRRIRNMNTTPFRSIPDYYEVRKDPNREKLGYSHFIISDLYDSYEEAFFAADSKNITLKGELLLHTSTNQYEVESARIDYDLDLCREYEKFVFERTTDMKVVGDKTKVKLPKKDSN